MACAIDGCGAERADCGVVVVYGDGRAATDIKVCIAHYLVLIAEAEVHYIEKCKVCQTVMGQCRCASPDKVVRWNLCAACQRAAETATTVLRNEMATWGKKGPA